MHVPQSGLNENIPVQARSVIKVRRANSIPLPARLIQSL